MAIKTIASVIGLMVIVVIGFMLFRADDNNLARDNSRIEVGATTTEDNLNGIGGPEEGFDPLEGMDTTDDTDEEDMNSKG